MDVFQHTLSFPSTFKTISPNAVVHAEVLGIFVTPCGAFDAFAICHKLPLVVSISCIEFVIPGESWFRFEFD